MTDLVLFGTLALLVTAATLLTLTRPLWRRSLPPHPSDTAGMSPPVAASEAALEVLREQLREIDEAHRLGQIDSADWELQRRDLAHRALAEASPATTDATATVRRAAEVDALAMHDRRMAAGIALGVVAIALIGYLAHGRPDLDALSTRPSTPVNAAVAPAQVEAMVLDMARELEARARSGQSGADEAPAWEMLARALASLQRFEDADRAYRQAIERDPQSARLLADRADVLRAVEGDRPSDEPLRLVQRSLRIDPQQPKALALAGRIAYERRDWRAAIDHWQRAQAVAPAGSDLALGLERGIAQAQAALREPGASAGMAAARGGADAPPGVSPGLQTRPLLGAPQPARPARMTAAIVSGRIDIAPALRTQARPDDTVFIVARATAAAMPAGTPAPRMPVAIVRLRVADLPARFEIDDRQAMSPDMRPSQFSELSVTARVARSGDAMPSAGDWTSDAITVQRGAPDIALRIDRVQR